MIVFALFWIVDADAAIYKWKDENGRTHFTDDPTKVPEEFRDKPFLRGNTSQAPKPKEKNVQDEGGETADKKEGAEGEKKADDKKESLTEAQRSAAEAAVSFLQADIPRYEKFNAYPPSRMKFRLLREEVKGTIPQKQALLGQVKQHDIPEFKAITGFLKASIAAAEKTAKLVTPATATIMKRTLPIMNRLKSETEQEKQLLESLETALGGKK